MANPWAGEADLFISGERRVLRLTLGALAELEAASDASVLEIVQRFETGAVSARDVLAVVAAGLRGGGWTGTARDLAQADIAGGFPAAARAASEALVRAFQMPEGGDAL